MTRIATVQALSLRTARALLPLRVESAQALAGLGLEDDIHLDACSPRQLLLASAAVYEEYSLPAHALRENLLIDLDTASLASGTVLRIGAHACIRTMFQCEACGQLDAIRPGLARKIGARRGVLARVLAGGVIRPGDAVHDLGLLRRPWPDDWRERVQRVLDAVPQDAVVEYAQLARLAGIQSSYCRAFPGLLAKLGPGYAGKAVRAQSTHSMERWNGHGLFDRA